MWLTRLEWQVVCILFIIEIMIVTTRINAGLAFTILWFCNITPALLIIAIFLKNQQLIKGITNIVLLPSIATIISLIVLTFFRWDPFLLLPSLAHSGFYVASMWLTHIFPAILALMLTRYTEPNRKALIYSFLILCFIFLATILFTPAAHNVNYIFNTTSLGFVIPYSTIFWVVLTFILLVLPSFFIQYIIFKFSSRGIKKKISKLIE